LVPCDLCDHSQISHVVSNDVRSDILLTTLLVITDWPISDRMIRTSHRAPVRRSVGTGSERAQAGGGEAVYKLPPDPALPPSRRLYTTAGREVVDVSLE
ncbi:unnamed protein product, partial [Staurois parvus]